MVRAPVLLLVLALAALPAAAEEEGATVAGTTERGRSLARILDNVLLPGGRPVTDARTLVFLLDATPSLQSAGFAAEFASALDRAAPQLGETQIGVLCVGAAAEPACDPTTDRAAVRAAVDEVLARPASSFQNLYADVRRAAALLKRHGGARDLVLVSLENGDGEDDLVGTARALRQGRITLHAVARQAFLSDTYWIDHAAQAPRGVDLNGADAAFVELPWGYLFQQGVANESVASGFPMYGLSRLAAESGGKVWLYYPPSTLGHRCSPSAGCLFCTQDHIPHDHGLQGHRLRTLAPSGGTRREALRAAAQDPAYRAVLEGLGAAREEGARAQPSVGQARGRRPPDREEPAGAVGGAVLHLVLQPRRARGSPRSRRARPSAATSRRTSRDSTTTRACPRYRAMGETTVVLLEITRVNLLLFAAFCREVAPRAGEPQGGRHGAAGDPLRTRATSGSRASASRT